MSEIRILLDMDEVLVDFIGGVCRLFGITRKELEEHWIPGEWDIFLPLCKAISRTMSSDEFWGKINERGETFWLGLDTMPWINELLKLVQSLTDDWHIVTSPSHLPCSYSGKVKWLKNWFGPDFDRFAITPHKEIFACKNVILVDDRQENVIRFREAGGEGILFPTQGNSLHKFTDNPLHYVTPVLESKINALNLQ